MADNLPVPAAPQPADSQPRSGRARCPSELRRFLALVFPFEFNEQERAAVQFFWPQHYPQPQPAGQRHGTEFAASRLELERLVKTGARGNLAMSYATFKPDSTGRMSRSNATFARSQSIGIDIDAGPGKEFDDLASVESHLEALYRETGIRPGIIISSGTGIQVYVLLDRPCKDAAPFQDALNRLRVAFGGDPAASDRARVLRPPCTRNWKYNPPRRVRLLSADEKRFNLQQILMALPPPRPPQPVLRASQGTQHPPSAPRSRRRVLADLKPLLDGVMPPGLKDDKSARDWLVVRKLAESGFSEEETLATIWTTEIGRDAFRRKWDPEYYLRRTVENAYTKPQAGGTR